MMMQGGVLYMMNAFMEPLCAFQGWSRAAVNASIGFAALMSQFAMPVMASLAGRFSLRRMMTLGAILGGLASIGIGMTTHFGVFTALLTLSWVSTQACGGVVGNALISNWFCRYRGRAFGIANLGTSLSGALLPFLALILVNHVGIQMAYILFGCATLLLAPLSWRIVHDRPEEMHLSPDGIPGAQRLPTPSPSMRHLFHDPHAYALGLAFGLALMGASGIMSQLKPRFADAGLSAYFAMTLACTSALFAAFAKFGWGWFCDKTTPLIATRLVMLLSALSLATSFLPPSVWSMTLFSVSFGCCIGGLWTILPAVVSYYFGNDHFLSCYKFISIFIILRSAGFPVLGLSFDLTGSYSAADGLFLGLLVVSFILTLFLHERDAAEKGLTAACS